MRLRKAGFVGLLAASMLFAGGPVFAEDFNWIMSSISKLASVDNGDGHDWSFKKTSSGWVVEGANYETAQVTSAGENKVSIDGFPANWGANGTYAFTKKADRCNLKSQDSFTHELDWKC